MKEKKQDLQHVYSLLTPFPDGLSTMADAMESHIKQIGLNAVKELDDESTVPIEFVEAMLAVHSKYTDIIGELFSGEHQFTRALDRSLASVVNDQIAVSKAPDWLVSYCDSLLKMSSKQMSKTERDNKQLGFDTISIPR